MKDISFQKAQHVIFLHYRSFIHADVRFAVVTARKREDGWMLSLWSISLGLNAHISTTSCLHCLRALSLSADVCSQHWKMAYHTISSGPKNGGYPADFVTLMTYFDTLGKMCNHTPSPPPSSSSHLFSFYTIITPCIVIFNSNSRGCYSPCWIQIVFTRTNDSQENNACM